MKKTSRRTAGFTLIELLTVIAIIGILAGIIIPTVGNVQERARRTTDLSNMKQVIQGAIIYANDNNGAFPKVEDKLSSSETSNQKTTIYRWIGIIAKNADLNDPFFYISKSDELVSTLDGTPTSIFDKSTDTFSTDFTEAKVPFFSVHLVAGLTQSASSTTPLIFTRGLDTTSGKWGAKPHSVYGDEGGYIGFVGGNVQWYKNVGTTEGVGVLTRKKDGGKTNNILKTIPTSARVLGRAEGATLTIANDTQGVE